MMLTNKQTRPHGELIPLPFSDKFPLLVQERLVKPVRLRPPPDVLVIAWRGASLGLRLPRPRRRRHVRTRWRWLLAGWL